MIRKLLITGVAFLSAIPVFANTTKFETGQIATAPEKPVALRLMNDKEFSTFLTRLDSDLLRSQLRMKKMDVKSLSLDLQEKQELERSYTRCLQSLDDTRDEIQKLSQKQTLKLDLFLLIDLNELARNLDALDETLMNPMAVNGTNGSQKSLGYAREVLGIDGALATQISTFQITLSRLPESSTRPSISPNRPSLNCQFKSNTGTNACRLSQSKRNLPSPSRSTRDGEASCIFVFGVTCRRGKWLRRERPSGLEAGSENSWSLFCRSAPRPNFLKLKRITGHQSLHRQAQLEITQGRGAGATAYCKGGSMDKIEACGIEVSAAELVVALSGKAQETVLRRFANTACGHRQLLQALTRGGSG